MSLEPVRNAAADALKPVEAENVPSQINAARGLQDMLHVNNAFKSPNPAIGEAIPGVVDVDKALSLRRGIGKYLPEEQHVESRNQKSDSALSQ